MDHTCNTICRILVAGRGFTITTLSILSLPTPLPGNFPVCGKNFVMKSFKDVRAKFFPH